jgi:hypothetical protein
MVDPWEAEADYVQSLKDCRPTSSYLAKVSLTQGEFDKWYRQAVMNTAFAGNRVEILRLESVAAARLLADDLFSFAFIDGDHRENAVMADLEAWWPKVKAGGIFAGHDYGTRGHDGVKRAVDRWTEKMGVKMILPGEFPRCWLVEKGWNHAQS